MAVTVLGTLLRVTDSKSQFRYWVGRQKTGERRKRKRRRRLGERNGM